MTPVDNFSAGTGESASVSHGERTEADLTHLRTVADQVMKAADAIAEMRWPGLDPDELRGSAVAAHMSADAWDKVVANAEVNGAHQCQV